MLYDQPAVDVYILLEYFDEGTLAYFRRQYLEGLRVTQENYWFPRDADEHEIEFETTDTWEMMRFLLGQPSPWEIFYFRGRGPTGISTGMVFFNPDKTLVLGVEVGQDEEHLYRQKLAEDFHSDLLLTLGDGCPPPDSKEEFVQWMGATDD